MPATPDDRGAGKFPEMPAMPRESGSYSNKHHRGRNLMSEKQTIAQALDIHSRDTTNVHLRQAAMKLAKVLRALEQKEAKQTP